MIDKFHPGVEDAVDRRRREIDETRAAEERALRAREAKRHAEQQQQAQQWCDWVKATIKESLAEYDENNTLIEAVGEVIGSERADRRKELQSAINAIEQKLARLQNTPGKLSAARDWKPATVFYQNEFCCFEGSSYQARCDTAQRPGDGGDWIVIARGAATPRVRGTYSIDQEYKALDIAVMDGAAFIARRDNPKICPGPDWQLLAMRGKSGRKGDTGPVGPRGEKGDKGDAVMPQIVSSKVDEAYNLVVLRSDNSLEIIPLREAFERFCREVGGGLIAGVSE